MFKAPGKFKYRALMLMVAIGLSVTWLSALARIHLETPVIQEKFANHRSGYNAVAVAHDCHNPVRDFL